MIKIDGHSHIGLDYHNGESNVFEYLNYIKTLGVDIGLIMPQPNPVYLLNNILTRPDLKNKNPYSYINFFLAEQVKNYNNLKFIPYLHSALDDEKYLNEYYEKYKPLAYKIHGIGSRTVIKDFNKKIISFLKNKNIPLIIHTDFVRNEENFRLKELRNGNTAYEWAKFLLENNLSGTLNHGCAYDERAFEIVNNSKQIMIALGPDLIVPNDSNRLIGNVENNYLEDIQNYVDINKMIFDLDYNWNVIKYKDDYEAINRFEKKFKKNNFEKVVSANAKKFYNI